MCIMIIKKYQIAGMPLDKLQPIVVSVTFKKYKKYRSRSNMPGLVNLIPCPKEVTQLFRKLSHRNLASDRLTDLQTK